MADHDATAGCQSLAAVQDEIDSLTDPEGSFVVRCGHRGDRPVPVADSRFPDRETAAEAARLTCEYRRRLRLWDPRTPYCAPIVHEESPATTDHRTCRDAGFAESLVERVRTSDGATAEDA